MNNQIGSYIKLIYTIGKLNAKQQASEYRFAGETNTGSQNCI